MINKKYKKNVDDSEVDSRMIVIKDFRDKLWEEINPYGNQFYGVEIHKPTEELEKILYKMKLYHFGDYSITNNRLFARYFYHKIAKK